MMIGGYFDGRLSLSRYLATVFPGQVVDKKVPVTTLSLGPVDMGAFAFAPAAPPTVSTGRTTTITVKGLGFNSLITKDTVRVAEVRVTEKNPPDAHSGTFYVPLADVAVDDVRVIDDKTMEIKLKV